MCCASNSNLLRLIWTTNSRGDNACSERKTEAWKAQKKGRVRFDAFASRAVQTAARRKQSRRFRRGLKSAGQCEKFSAESLPLHAGWPTARARKRIGLQNVGVCVLCVSAGVSESQTMLLGVLVSGRLRRVLDSLRVFFRLAKRTLRSLLFLVSASLRDSQCDRL